MGSVEGSERLGLPEARRIVAPRAARCTKFGNLVGLVLSWRTVFALLVLRATRGCCTRAHQGSAVVMLSPSRLDLDPSGPRPAALSTVAHYEKTYRAPQRTNLVCTALAAAVCARASSECAAARDIRGLQYGMPCTVH